MELEEKVRELERTKAELNELKERYEKEKMYILSTNLEFARENAELRIKVAYLLKLLNQERRIILPNENKKFTHSPLKNIVN